MKQLPEPENTGVPARYQYVEVPAPGDAPPEPESGGLLEYWLMFRRRKGTLALFALLGALVAFLLSLPQTPIYQATATIEILNLNEDLLNRRQLESTTQESYDPQFNIRTQINILQSKTLEDRVLAKLGPKYASAQPADTSRMAAWRKFLNLSPAPVAPASKSKGKEWTGPDYELAVRAVTGTRLVKVSCDSPDPRFAVDYANTITSEFIDQNVEVRYQASQRTGEWLSRQLEELKIKLERSEDELQRYASSQGLQFTGEKDSVAEDKLVQLQSELTKAQSERVAKQSKYELASSADAASLPEILDDASLRTYQARITELEQQLAELSETLTPSHYKVKRTQAQIDTVKAAFEKQRANVLARIKNEYNAALGREKLLLKAYTEQSRFVAGQNEKAIHYNILRREVETGRQLYDGMLQKVKEYGIASAMQASNVRVVDAAEVPDFPYKPNYPLNSALGVLIGLMLGAGFVVIRERADRSIQAPGETPAYADLPELGVIPAAAAVSGRHGYYTRRLHTATPPAEGENRAVELMTWQQKPSLVAESFRAVVTSLLFASGDKAPGVVVVTSASPKEGKSTVASNLALALSEVNRRVLLIDADLRRPRQHHIFGLSNDAGLVDLLRAPGPLNGDAAPVLETAYPGVFVIPAGACDSTVFNLLHSPRLRELLERARKEFDAVIIDTPPMLNISDARVLGRAADGVVLVVRAGETTRDSLLAAAQRFAEDGTRIIGTVLNDWNPRKHQSHGYGYDYRSYRGYYDSYYKHYAPKE